MTPDPKDVDSLVREKYAGDKSAKGVADDIERLSSGEPLAYVIGHIPFLGLSLALDSRPLIPRPETEWWTEALIKRIGTHPFRILDLCAGSGAIGLAVLAHCPYTIVSFGELSEMDCDQIAQNLERNRLDIARADVRQGDLFKPFADERFDLIATNPPYIPEGRALDTSVRDYEPPQALFAGSDGLAIIRRILKEAPHHLHEGGEVWLECDSSNIEEAMRLAEKAGFSHSRIRSDQYGRPRLLVSYLG